MARGIEGRDIFSKGYTAFMEEAHGGAERFLSSIRKANTNRDQATPGAYVIGDPEFVRGVLAKDRERRLMVARHKVDRVTVDELTVRFAQVAGIDHNELRLRGRASRRARARKLFAYVCHRLYGFTTVEVSRYLGCTQPPVSIAIKKIHEMRHDPEIAKILIKIRPQ
jgi:chromosomal replication initiation ATPase DnaA